MVLRAWTRFLFLAGVLTIAPAMASHDGITGRTTAGCTAVGCHDDSGNFGTSNGFVSFPSPSTAPLVIGRSYGLSFTRSTSATEAGFNLGAVQAGTATSVGSFSASGGTRTNVAGSEVTHAFPDAVSGGSAVWSFTYTPPASAQNVRFRWCSQGVNANNLNTGDGPFSCSTVDRAAELNVAPQVTGSTCFVFLETSAAARVLNMTTSDGNARDASALTFAWSPSAGLSSTAVEDPTFTGSARSFYTFTVSDPSSATDDITVTADIDDRPSAVITNNPGSVIEGTSVTVSGTTSSDRRVDPSSCVVSTTAVASYSWRLLRGATQLQTGSGSTFNFTAPEQALGAQETLTIELITTDNRSQSSVTVTQNINVADIAVGDPAPIINSITATDPANENRPVTLTANVSDNLPIAAGDYVWTQTSGSPTVTLSGSGNTRTFTAPDVAGVGVGPTLGFQVDVTDSVGQSVSDTVSVTINNGPVADAGADQAVDEGDLVDLSGAGSTDAEGALTYAWSRVSGPAVTLTGGTTVAPSFTAPDVGRDGDTLVLSLTVTDAGGITAVDQVAIDIANVNAAPTAIAGPDQNVSEGASVTLAGDFTDPDDPGSTITFAWTQTGGTTVGLSSATVADPTFTAPQVAAAGETLTFSLVVTDEGGLASAADEVQILVGNVNQPPTADAGPDQSVAEGDSVTLNGSNSDDDDDRAVLVYAWTQSSGSSATVTGADTAMPTFTAPEVGFDTTNALVFDLVVTDTQGLVDTDQVIVNVSNENLSPVADAGPDQTVDEETDVVLSGANSTDPDLDIDDALTYAWAQTAGPALALTGADTATPSFVAPAVTPAGISATFELTVTDRGGAMATDTVIVNVANVNQPPVADAGPDQAVTEGATVDLSGDNSRDPDGGVTAFSWRQVSGVAITLSAPGDSNTTFVAPRISGTTAAIVLELTVTGNEGLRATDQVTVNVVDESAEPPVANAGPDQTVTELALVMLDGSASSDLDGNIETFLWSQTSGPAVELSSAMAIAPTFTAPQVSGSGAALVFELQVVDADGISATDTVTINVSNGGTAPISNAGSDQSVPEGTTVVLDASGSSDQFDPELAFQWRQLSGPAVVLSDPTAVAPTFVAPGIAPEDSGIALVFEVAVTNDDGLSATDTVTVIVTDNGIVGFADDVPTVEQPDGTPAALTASGGSLVAITVIDPASITENAGRPDGFFGALFDIRAVVPNPGDTVTVSIEFDAPLPANATWAKFSDLGGWRDFGANAAFSDDRTRVDITLTDGGNGDDDGMANGVIVDPSGPASFPEVAEVVNLPAAEEPERRSGGGCTVASGGSDPLLPLMLLICLAYFLRRRGRTA